METRMAGDLLVQVEHLPQKYGIKKPDIQGWFFVKELKSLIKILTPFYIREIDEEELKENVELLDIKGKYCRVSGKDTPEGVWIDINPYKIPDDLMVYVQTDKYRYSLSGIMLKEVYACVRSTLVPSRLLRRIQ